MGDRTAGILKYSIVESVTQHYAEQCAGWVSLLSGNQSRSTDFSSSALFILERPGTFLRRAS